MRKADPGLVRSTFDTNTSDLIDSFHRLSAELSGSSHEMADLSFLASTTFLTLFVSFEGFISDLFLAYLNRDFSRYQKWLANKMNQSIKERFGDWPAARTTFSHVKHISVDQVERIVDPKGWNLTFKTSDDITSKAQDWLADPHKQRVQSISRSQKDLMDAARAIRNFIAHRSSGSKAEMNQKLQEINLNGGNLHLQTGVRQVNDEGAYLKTVMTTGERRLVGYAERLRQIAAQM